MVPFGDEPPTDYQRPRGPSITTQSTRSQTAATSPGQQGLPTPNQSSYGLTKSPEQISADYPLTSQVGSSVQPARYAPTPIDDLPHFGNTPITQSSRFSPKLPDSRPTTPKARTFGVPLEEVISRENGTLPHIVMQCVIAIDQFGLTTEGIYRISGGAKTVAKLKHLFESEPDNVDFRTPAGYYDDIHAVAGILKQYLRELPDPLLTKAFYDNFINASGIYRVKVGLMTALEVDIQRRDAVHSFVNDLPDANYSCIRTLALHLHKYDVLWHC
jgi:Rho GTPase-activating protein RGD1